MKRAAALGALLFTVFFLAWACANSAARVAHADSDKLVVSPDMPNATRIETRLRSRLQDDDDIWVRVYPQGYKVDLPLDKVIVIWANGGDVRVVGNDWVPQAAVDDMLYRTQNVNRNPIDTVMGVIQLVHDYQGSHPKPVPPPPPTLPTPPKAPEPPFDWGPYMIYIYIGGPILVLFLIWLPLHIRLMRRRAKLARDAEEQADWGFDKYGIKTSLDL